jgi:arabinogalactan endo-1,4-beta-galactosidase
VNIRLRKPPVVLLQSMKVLAWMLMAGVCMAAVKPSRSQAPAQPVDVSPINGETYRIVNQNSAMVVDLRSATAGDYILQEPRSFSSLTQQWSFTRLTGNYWKISNRSTGMCLDQGEVDGAQWIIENSCSTTSSQQWTLTPVQQAGAQIGSYTFINRQSGQAAEIYNGSIYIGAYLGPIGSGSSVPAYERWVLVPTFFRGVDNAQLERQEQFRVTSGIPWWNDEGTSTDILQILKNHGVNMLRLRPTWMQPSGPYAPVPAIGQPCNDSCDAETDSQDLNLAVRARNLGMALEVTLLFDGGSSDSLPASWTGETFSQLQQSVYNYAYAEIAEYGNQGTMPDMVSVGNELDIGTFLGTYSPFSSSGTTVQQAAELLTSAINGVHQAADDLSLPRPITCLHITSGPNLASFGSSMQQYGVAYDALCESYYPFWAGPVNDSQTPIDDQEWHRPQQDKIAEYVNAYSKPVFIIETSEHSESGGAESTATDTWYSPYTAASQRQYLIDLESMLKGVSNNFGMGFMWWDATGVNIPYTSGGTTYYNRIANSDFVQNQVFYWNGLDLFDPADASGNTISTASNYSNVLPALDALGGKLDPLFRYKFINQSNGTVLEIHQASIYNGAWLDGAADTGIEAANQIWSISSNGDGYFKIVNAQVGYASASELLSINSTATPSPVITQNSATGSTSQEWDIVSAGVGSYYIVSKSNPGYVVDLNGTGDEAGFAILATKSSTSATQKWQIVPVH